MEIVHTASFRDKNLLGVDQNISHQRGPFSSQHRHRTELIFLKRAKMAFKPEHGTHQRSDTGRSFHFHADFLKKKKILADSDVMHKVSRLQCGHVQRR